MPKGERRDAVAKRSAEEITKSLESLGLYLGVDATGETVSLVGQVDSDDNRVAALDVARAVAGRAGLLVQDSIEVVPDSPGSAFDVDSGASLAESSPGRDLGAEAASISMPFDADLNEPIDTTDSEEAAAEAVPYFPPTDPVVRPSDDVEGLDVVGGFAATSMDEGQEGGPAVEAIDDEMVAEQVLRELREDASTTDLRIDVAVVNGVVRLLGSVPSMEDAENVEAVAARVPGVVETEEQLRVIGLENGVRSD